MTSARTTKVRKTLRWTAIGLAGIVILVFSFVAFLLRTETGTRSLLRFAPATTHIARVEGSVLGGLTLHGVEHEAAAADITIERLRLDWEPSGLWRRRARIDSLTATGVTVRRKAPADPDTTAAITLPDVRLPVSVEIDRLLVRDVLVFAPPGAPGATRPGAGDHAPAPPADTAAPLRIDRIEGSATASRVGEIDISALEVEGPTFWAHTAGRLEARGDYPLELQFAWRATPPQGERLEGEGQLGGSLARLDFRHDLRAPVAAHLEGRATDVLGAPAWEAELAVPEFSLDAVRPDLAPHRLRTELRASGGTDRATVTGTAGGALATGERLDASFRAVYADRKLRVDSLLLGLPGGGRLSAEADVDPTTEPIRFSAAGRWSSVVWPADSVIVSSRAGRFTVSGTPAAYDLRVDATLGGPSLPAGEWSLAATGDTAGLALRRISGRTLGGSVRGSGTVAWAPRPAWRLRLAGDGLDPAAFRPDWPGRVSFGLATSGELRAGDAGMDARFSVDSLSGTLRDRPLSGGLRLGLAGERIALDTLRLGLGDTRLDAGGVIADTWDLGWSLEVASLADISPEATGRLSASGTLSGRRAEPLLSTTIEGEDLVIDSLEVSRLAGEARIDLSGREESELMLTAPGVDGPRAVAVLGGERLPVDLRLSGRGTPSEHRLELSAHAPRDTLTIAVAGAARGIGDAGAGTPLDWRGTLERLALAGSSANWQLREPAPLQLGADSARIDEACLESADGEACLAARWARESGASGNLEATNVRLAALAPILPPDLQLEGLLTAAASGEIDPDGAMRGEATISAGPGELRYPSGSGELIRRELEAFRLQARASGGRLEAEAALAIEGGRFEGSLSAPLPTGDSAATAASAASRASGASGGQVVNGDSIRGRLTGELDDRGLAGTLADGLEATKGTLRVDLTARGTMAEPDVTGEVTLADAGARLPALGIGVDSVRFRAANEAPGRWSLAGAARSDSGEGDLELDGSLQLARPGTAWAANLSVRGDSFPAYRTADADVSVSPDLDLRADANGAEVSGEIRVPLAELTPGNVTRAVKPSTDVVFVGGGARADSLRALEAAAAAAPGDSAGGAAGDSAGDSTGARGAAVGDAGGGDRTADATALPMARGEVRVVMGDSVKLDAFGVEGRLAGDIVANYETARPIVARGQLDIVDGTYTAYRQKLEIERGRLLFAGGPITNPGLDLRVVRRPEDVVVGLQVTGTAEVPQTTLFSEPPMADSEALSYLVLGRPLSGASQRDGELLANAANSAGLAGGSLLAARLGARFGLEQAKIEQDGDAASLLLGTHLTPNLFVAYSLGLFEAVSVITIRYELGKGWVVQTKSGLETGADILYTIEK